MFDRQENVTITGFDDISINLFVPGVNNDVQNQTGTIEIQLRLSNNKQKTITYDLLTRLGNNAAGITHRTNLLALKDYILTRIESEVLPT